MYAIFEKDGQQYKAEEGAIFNIDKLSGEENATITFDNVLLVSDGTKVTTGEPYVNGASVVAKIVKHDRDKKIIVFNYKAKVGSNRKKQGHRQPYTRIQIEKINV